MAKWIFLGAPWLVCLTFLGVGAGPRQNRPFAEPVADCFVCQPFPADIKVAAGDPDPARLFARALADLRQAPWLRLTVWQRLHDPQDGYESEAHLTLGPDFCARMETTVRTGKVKSHTLLISDGRAVAEVVRLPGAREKVTGAYLPAGEAADKRGQYLQERGCVGPLPLLTELHQLVATWKLDTGFIAAKAVYRLQGEIDGNVPKQKTLAARSCRLYLDAATFLPVRLEWWTADRASARLRLEMEFRDLEINRALSAEECARVFSYQSN